ncbi:Ger(x)C family spore germination protein [Paenibacillus sp. 2TAB19]|uniref:Ger(x)C family spore germination protein n=1 Tax=Paenibacillus sp. 2TAB19 TaxID=3233003 RepID=UPI003F9A94CB
MSTLFRRFVGTCVVCLLLAGCSDQLSLENAATPLALGMDLDRNGTFKFYSSSPVFSKNIKKKSVETGGSALTLRESRAKQDAQLTGAAQGRNYQVIIVGKRMLQHDDWFKMMDVIYRDARNTVTDRMVMYDGAVSEIIGFNQVDQPPLPILLRGMIDSNSSRSETVHTTAQELHRQMYERGITPSISEVRLQNNKVILFGSALLNHRGKYMESLGAQESILLNILKGDAKAGISLSYPMPDKPMTGPFHTNIVSFSAGKVKVKVKSGYKQGKFHFDITLASLITLSEEMFAYNIGRDDDELARRINEQCKKQLEKLIAKFQSHRIDPIGLGLYARAHHFRQYEKVQEHWGNALADAEIAVHVKFTIGAMGPVQGGTE